MASAGTMPIPRNVDYDTVQGWSYFLSQRFSACFALKFVNLPSRGERGRKGRECKFLSKAHRTFHQRNSSTPVLSVKSISSIYIS